MGVVRQSDTLPEQRRRARKSTRAVELLRAMNRRNAQRHQLNEGAILKYCRTFAACFVGRSRDGHGGFAALNRSIQVLRCRHPSRGGRLLVDRRGAETRTCMYLCDRMPSTAGSARQYTGCEHPGSARLPNRRRLSIPRKLRGTMTFSAQRCSSSNLQCQTREEHAPWFRRHRRIGSDPVFDGSASSSRYHHDSARTVESPRQLRPKAFRVPPAPGARSIFGSCVAVFHDETSTAVRNHRCRSGAVA